MEISLGFWFGFIAFIMLLLLLDLFVFHKQDTAIKVKSALLWSAFWISLAFLFNVGIYYVVGYMENFELGRLKAMEFFTGYLIEKSLSVDNLFVFLMIFGYFKIESKFQHRILFWGIIGAIIMRAIFIFAGVALINQFAWIMYVFGAFLVFTGLKMLFEKEDAEFNPNHNIVIRLFKKIMPVTDENKNSQFFVKKNSILYATPFFITLLFIEVSDVIFAVDSIPAVLSVSTDPFIVFSSNIFAIMGLRSLYFALNGIMEYFQYLKYALSGILTFIGIKMCLNEFSIDFGYSYHISNLSSLGVIVIFLTASILLSVYVNKRAESKGVK